MVKKFFSRFIWLLGMLLKGSLKVILTDYGSDENKAIDNLYIK